VTGQGFGPREFALLGYGGGGPLHVAGFSHGLGFDDVLVPSWAAGFSAFGCVCADYAYRLDRQFDQPLPLGTSNGEVHNFIRALNDTWAGLRAQVSEEFRGSGIPERGVNWQPSLRVQYTGQLNDIELPVASMELTGPSDLADIADAFEAAYGKLYGSAARTPEVGYYVTLAILTGSTEIEKPALAVEPLANPDDIDHARKASRDVYADGRWQPFGIFDLDALRAGSRIVGPAVLEAPSTTFYLPPERTATIDQHRIFHLRESN
jgi:N-methylhydantoinase A/acetone carboxylase beta subunit